MRADATGMIKAPVDQRIKYPCYKSFDEFIDVERLKSLNGYIIERIKRHIKERRDTYFLNEHRLDAESPHQPGVREIWLSRTRDGVPYNYLDLNRTGLWEPTAATAEFSLLMDFIATLPFKATGRMLIIYDDRATAVPAHRDHLQTDICHEFLWFRTNLQKPFYLLNNETGEKLHVESYSAWFDSVNQFHGSDACDGLSFSVRVDGLFTDKFRKRIPTTEVNQASIPALWACSSEQIIRAKV